nr:immunoglobulin heavy chain junction region [Macaca mulatta]MOW90212.1 immunoglobulin heavy chain junction region [Macaca mulatta]MOW92428.1 immunoglobulin heavy chain junction region [Macaca mulatta]
CARSHSNFDYW